MQTLALLGFGLRLLGVVLCPFSRPTQISYLGAILVSEKLRNFRDNNNTEIDMVHIAAHFTYFIAGDGINLNLNRSWTQGPSQRKETKGHSQYFLSN